MAFFRPSHCTEREADGTFEDCVPCSGVMLANAHAGADVHPVTNVEYEALRAASKPKTTTFVTLGELKRGLKDRYGWSGPIVTGAANVWQALTPSTAAAGSAS